jgi:hypothetical protein
MSTISVWILVLYMGAGNAGGPAIIDNLPSKAECDRVAEALKPEGLIGTATLKTATRCIETKRLVIQK